MSDPPSAAEPASPAEPPRSWWQFSLRTMFVLFTLLILGLVWLANGPEGQRRTVAALRAKGVVVKYEDGSMKPHTDKGWLPADYYLTVHEIEFDGPHFTDESLEQALRFTGLKRLIVKGCSFTDQGLARLNELPSLERLELLRSPLLVLVKPKLSDNCLASLKDHPSLRELLISDEHFSEAVLVHVGQMRQLRQLTLLNSWVTDDALRHLAGMNELESLSVQGTQIRGLGLQHLAKMTSLRELNLSWLPLHDEHVGHLHSLRSLEKLDLNHTAVSDEFLNSLLELPRLRELEATWGWDSDMTQLRVRTALKVRNAAADEAATKGNDP